MTSDLSNMVMDKYVTPTPSAHPPINPSMPLSYYDLNMRVTPLGCPILRVVGQPMTPGGVPSLIACGNYITFNNCHVRQFMVIETLHLTLRPDHITYIIRDLIANVNIYLLVPGEWTTGNSC